MKLRVAGLAFVVGVACIVLFIVAVPFIVAAKLREAKRE